MAINLPTIEKDCVPILAEHYQITFELADGLRRDRNKYMQHVIIHPDNLQLTVVKLADVVIAIATSADSIAYFQAALKLASPKTRLINPKRV